MNKDIHGVEHETHLNRDPKYASELAVGLAHQVAIPTDVDESVDYSVWDEPSFSSTLAGPPPKNALTFRNWMNTRTSQWTAGQSWFLTISLALVSGPASIAAFLLLIPNMGWLTPVVECFFSPLMQELAKIALLLWVVERRPYYFKNGFQILLCAIAGGVVFGIVSGLISLATLSSARPSIQFAFAISYFILHLVCSLFAASGLYNIWKRPTQALQPARLADGASSFLTAFVIHAVFATLLLAARTALAAFGQL